ncbi:MAG: hypothetical protein ACOX65_01755 [Anaerotruncus rubiinfantis]
MVRPGKGRRDMRRDELKQMHSLILEIEEEEARRYNLGAWSLFGDDSDFMKQNAEQIMRMRGWIQEIPDSVTRRAFALRYVDGLDWIDVAVRMGYSSPDGPRKVCERYLEKNSV